ncbi:EI24 domain-containing protein [Hasllibacter sp. MH4015]|uniref:EI24 domain-containing protein n=1 Tax=Hasllibacter sp. MH4015 TaxID=2854029 RepID=UPI001CD22F5A|nr:EI24 domain-containing protein [Hasllibacter sp. MH4015]
MIFTAFLKALGQLTDSRFLGVLGLGLVLTIGLLVGFYALFAGVVGWFVPDTFTLPWIGEVNWIDNALTIAGIPLMLVLSIFLMVPVSAAFMGIFLDRVSEAVEDQHYPGLPPARGLTIGEALVDVAKFLGILTVVNILALLFYLISGPFAPLVFWVVNGILLGREYGQMVALRRNDARGAAEFRKRNRPTLFAAGVLMAVPLTIPVVNILVPILGAATFTHLYHMLNRAGARPSRTA